MSGRIVCRLIWVPSTLALIGTVVAFAQIPYTLPPPGPMVRHVTSDRSVTLSHPGNWPARSLSLHDTMAEVVVEPAKNVRFEVSTDLMGSLMADVARSTNSMLDPSNLPPGLAGPLTNVRQKTPLEKVHEAERAVLEKEFEGYKEGATTGTHLAGLEALATDFTYQEHVLWEARPMVGRRMTALASERRITVMYYGPREMLEKLAPTFEQMIQNLHVGQAGG